ncbi:XRE family transcriptional regulator [Streptomyces sp. B1866]|uniref:helix-turn-helix domain-containing protein n=1 Tax=Streptomyces sp. B1866 TaxID=3075431 RepID=UPI00288FA958|nr:XRE family transcriptional regulator [Streptomyces sp. B1866]MDT3397334.1 XRE family transcriptional regulator [Streptomyces sp. B1866]
MASETRWQEIGARLGEARRAADLTQGDFAARVGLERTVVSKIETGARKIGALELTRMADVLGLPVDHFLAAPPPVLSNRQPLLEEDESAAAKSAFRIQACLGAWLRDVRQLLEIGVLAQESLWSYPYAVSGIDSYRQAAQWVRERIGEPAGPLGSMAEVCAAAGQWPLATEIPGDGASLIDGDVAVSVISLRGEPGRRRATAAHELGHMVMGDAYSNDLGVHASIEERERAIEVFAAELLIPVSAVSDAWSSTGSSRDQLIKLAARYRVSWTLALGQAERAEVIDSAERRALTGSTPTRAEFLQALGWVPEADLSAIRVAPTYADAVLAAFRRGAISRARAAEMLHGQVRLEDLPPGEEATI